MTREYNAKSASKAKKKIGIIVCFLSIYVDIRKTDINRIKYVKVLYIGIGQAFLKKVAWIDLVYFG